VIWISEDLDDLLSYAHRIAVMHDGRISGIMCHDRADRQTLGRWMAGDSAAAA
jgi:simple sugar transport system ATP-binding protein